MGKVGVDLEQLKGLVKLSKQNGTQDIALDVTLDWAEQVYNKLVEYKNAYVEAKGLMTQVSNMNADPKNAIWVSVDAGNWLRRWEEKL